MVIHLQISAHRLCKSSGAGCSTLLAGMASIDIPSAYSATQQVVVRDFLFPGVGLGGAHGGCRSEGTDGKSDLKHVSQANKKDFIDHVRSHRGAGLGH